MEVESGIIQEYKTIAEYDSVVKKRVADSWNPDQERILKIWAEKASGWAWLHDKSARFFNQLTNKYMYPSIVLSTVSSGIGFSMYGSVNFQSTSKYMVVVIGCMNLMSALLASLQKFARSTEKAELHSHMHKLFSSYCRKIVMELALQPCDRKECVEFCKTCRDEYDKLVTDSPEIPNEIIADFKNIFKTAKHVPEIANGLVHFHDFKVTQEGIEWDRRRSKDVPRGTALQKIITEMDISTSGHTKDAV